MHSPRRSREGSPVRYDSPHPWERGESIEVLERLVNQTLLSTQRVTHLNILALGEELLTTKKKRQKRAVTLAASPMLPVLATEEESDNESTDRLEERLAAARSLAVQEKQRALQEQEQSFTKRLEEVAQNRDHLEAERLGQFRRKLEQEKVDALQAQRRSFEAEKQEAVASACAELCHRVRHEVEQERSRDVERALAAVAKEHQRQLIAAVQEAQTECQTQAEEERARLIKHHALEIQKLQDEISGLRSEMFWLIQKRKDYEWQFQEVQLNYKRFIDLTESSLHSDYLLRLQHLGLPPGHADAGAQTDDVLIKRDNS